MAGQNQKQPGEDGIFTLLFVGIFLFILFWYLGGVWKYGRLIIYRYYVEFYNFIFDILHFKPLVIQQAHEFLNIYEPKEISVDQMKKLSSDLYPYFSAPFMVIIAAFYIKKLSKAKSYNQVFTRKSLIQNQKQKWAWLHPIADLELEPDVEKGSWAMAKKPLTFVKKYDLLDENEDLKEGKAHVVFSQQLGRLFSSFEEMEDYEQALMTIFAAHSLMSKESKKDAYKWLSILSITHKNPDYSWVKAGWEKYKNSEKVQEALTQHAYVNTVLMRMLENARGVLPTSYFVWLKPKNRILFFSLNCLGRKEHFTEAAGCVNHFFAEKEMKSPILTQYVNDAVAGLSQAVHSIKITDENYYDLKIED